MQLDASGAASVMLGAVAGTDPESPPITACYMSNNPTSGSWLPVSDGESGDAWCGLTFSGSNWTIRMQSGVAGWWAAFVVVY